MDLPALAPSDAVLMSDTSMQVRLRAESPAGCSFIMSMSGGVEQQHGVCQVLYCLQLSDGIDMCRKEARPDRRGLHMQNTFICQPQQRNLHGRIFGGFLMR